MSINPIEILKLEASMLAILTKLHEGDVIKAQKAQQEAFKRLEADRAAGLAPFNSREFLR
jgi:hypothetical protein